MGFKRNRTTWGKADRKASAAPAVPGYGREDQDHPAHQDDPAYEKYQKGDPSAWAEDVHQPPYLEGNPPAVPGYDSEDQDHPAHKRPPRVPKDATLSAQIQRKAAKCLVLARHQLGKQASQDLVESQALDMMDLPDNYIEASLKRVGGGFLAMDDDMFLGDEMDMGMDDDMFLSDEMDMDDDMYAMDDDMFGMDDDMDLAPAGPGDSMMSMMHHMAAEIRSLKAQLKGADQNDPKGETLAPKVPSEDEVRAEAGATEKSAAANLQGRIASYFAANGGGEDGFALASDWSGSKALFAALDTDGDGIVASSEMVAAMFDPSNEMLAMADDYLEDEVEMLNACGEMVLAGELPEAFKKNIKKKDDSKENDESKGDDKLPAFLKNKKAEDEGSEDEDSSKDEEDGSDKEAADLFNTAGSDPMGLGGGDSLTLTAADEALLSEIFESGTPGHTANDLDLMPQPRQASNGVTTLGQQTRTASAGKGSVNELSKLWKSAPDVSKVFGIGTD